MGIERTVNRSSNFPTLRARDLPFAFAMQLLLTTATLCSVLWLWLSNDGLISTRLSMPKEISTKFLVDINQATSPEIANLPKVGPSLAKAITEYRKLHGPFASAEELTNVSGIGDKKLAAITPFMLPLRWDCSPEHRERLQARSAAWDGLPAWRSFL